MSESKQPRNYSAYQQKIIKRYYNNIDGIALQRLADLAGELYLAEGQKTQRAWEHCVPKVARAGPRISIAYRYGLAIGTAASDEY